MKLYKEIGEVRPGFMMLEDSDPAPDPTKFALTNVVADWLRALQSSLKDYKWKRQVLKPLGDVDTATFDAYSDFERYELCKVKAVSSLQLRLDVLGLNYDEWMSDFDTQSLASRSLRFKYAKSILLRTVATPDAYTILSQLESDKLESRYLAHGIEGTIALNPDYEECLLNYIDATPESEYYNIEDGVKVVKSNYLALGIVNNSGVIEDSFGNALGKYENDGIRAMALTILPESTLTQVQLIVSLLDCLKNGNY